MLYLRDIDVDVHVRCCACGHSGVLPRAMLERRFGPNYPVLSIAPHYRCSVCDSRDTESRPAPHEAGIPAMPSALEEAPSFDGPLAALRGLLDAARAGSLDDDGDDAREDDDIEGAGRTGPFDGEEEKPFLPAFRTLPSLPPVPPVYPADADSPPPAFSLEDLVKDTSGQAEGRTPLWEPVSLADIASRLDRSAEAEETEDDGPQPEPEDWQPAGRSSRPAQDHDSDETLFAMRRFLARDDAQADTAEPVPAADLEEVLEDDADEDAFPPAFTPRTLARTDFEDDTADGDDPWENDEDDDDPTEEEILAFAIRDPERPRRPEPPPVVPMPSIETPPARPPVRPPVRPMEDMPERSVRGSDGRDFEDHDASMEKTLAALRSMIEEAAAEPELPAGPDQPSGDRPSSFQPSSFQPSSFQPSSFQPSSFEPSSFRAGDLPASDEVAGDEAEDDDPFPVRMSLKDVEPPEELPTPRRSSQEMEIEQAMRSLRDLMTRDEPSGSSLPPPPPAPKSRQRSPAFGRGDDGQDGSGYGFSGPQPERHSLPPATQEETSVEPPPRRREGKGGEPSALDKTIAALRGMLELDGKRKK